MHEIADIEQKLQHRYPGLCVRRDGQAVVVHIPVRFRRRNGRQIILAEGQAAAAASTSSADGADTLIGAIARAHRWQEQIEAGQFATIEELARELGFDRTYVGRMLRLTSLAPDIVEAILRGNEPDGLSLEKLRKDLPPSWREQRRRWRCTVGN